MYVSLGLVELVVPKLYLVASIDLIMQAGRACGDEVFVNSYLRSVWKSNGDDSAEVRAISLVSDLRSLSMQGLDIHV